MLAQAMRILSDWELVTLHMRGEPRALGILMERHRRNLYGYLRRLFDYMPADARHEHIQDVMQETWIRVDRHASSGRQESRFTTWLFAIATNLAHNVFRDRQRKEARFERIATIYSDREEGGGELEQQLADEQPESRPDLALERKEARTLATRRLQEILKQLTPEQRTVLSMRGEGPRSGGMSYAAMAVQLNIKLGTIKSQLNRGRKLARAIRGKQQW